MRSACLALLLAAGPPLAGQGAVARVLRARELELLDAPPATLLLLPAAGDRAFVPALQALLDHPALAALRVPAQVLPPGDPEAARLRAQAGLGVGSAWILREPGTRRLGGRGLGAPTEPALLDALHAEGFQDRAAILTAYLRRHPENREARAQLLQVLWSRGELGALRGLPPAPAGGPTPAKAEPLSPVRDLECWSPFTGALDAAFRDGSWRELDLGWLADAPPVEGASPTLQGLYIRWLPEVEGALREDPSSEALWSLWCRMSGATGGRHLDALLASLAPSPLTPPGDWPPEGAARLLLAAAKTPADWQALETHYAAAWDAGSHPLLDRAARGAEEALAADWRDSLEPLLTCELRLGATARAEAVLRAARDASRWSGLGAKAAALAERCGQKALAARWAALDREAAR
ncbi:MAG TPA: hypothetical protein VFT46_12090 [Holophagaceae bacterium]|nr:hypothetical protein [Holophagaceae bacterium]